MSSLLKSVRIVHSPLEKTYIVQEKPLYRFRWVNIERYEYVTVPNTSPHGPHDLAPAALKRAQDKAEMLLARTVVWERTNYVWYS